MPVSTTSIATRVADAARAEHDAAAMGVAEPLATRLPTMRSSSAGSLSTTSRVGTAASVRPRAAACGANSARTRAKSVASATSRALGRERAGVEARKVEQLRELGLEQVRGGLDMAHQRPPFRLMRACGERGDVQAERVQRLAQVVACGGEELALGAICRFRRRARVQCRARVRSLSSPIRSRFS